MKKILFIIVLLGGQGSFAETKVHYQCRGYYGAVTVAFDSPYYSLSGALPTSQGNFNCQGKMGQVTKNFAYFSTNKGCAADYLRVDNALFSKGQGNIALVNTSGGDTHDNSGYVYKVFQCQVN